MQIFWYGDEPVVVETRFRNDGQLQPTAFKWRGRRWHITGKGRQWDQADGQHVLVETSDGSRFELCLNSDQRSWRLRRAWEQQYTV